MLRLLLQPQGGDFVGVGAELGADLGFGAEHLGVEMLSAGGEGVAGGVEGDLDADVVGFVGAEGVVGGGDGFDAVIGVVGGVVLDGQQGEVGIDVVVEDMGLDAGGVGAGHGGLRLDLE